MDRQDVRLILHGVAVGGWLSGLALDAKRGRWGAFGFALGCHAVAEIVGRTGRAPA